ncbi:hypothetical protein H5410_002332 [Solanum commersonii]|uniref:Uncharacterized protein n=1 Tax=Solanum commersonii TaxID=4109 RepID=A0A9J6B2K1_SOLCO|nr:hypothetical protein H5410_002332 [Solanum commersonii]
MGDEYANEGRLLEDFPHILVEVHALGLHYIFEDQGQVLSAADRQAWDDSSMGHMFGMAELQLRIGGHPMTEDEMETLVEHYSLSDSAMYICRMGPVFQEPIDDDAIADEEDE